MTDTVKICFYGDSAGKTSLIKRLFSPDSYKINETATIGADFITVKEKLGDSEVSKIIWDIEGQKKDNALAAMYYKNSQVIVLCVDASKAMDVPMVSKKLSEITQKLDGKKAKIIIVATKTDLKNNHSNEIKNFAEDRQLSFISTSARANLGIQELNDAINSAILNPEDIKHRSIEEVVKEWVEAKAALRDALSSGSYTAIEKALNTLELTLSQTNDPMAQTEAVDNFIEESHRILGSKSQKIFLAILMVAAAALSLISGALAIGLTVSGVVTGAAGIATGVTLGVVAITALGATGLTTYGLYKASKQSKADIADVTEFISKIEPEAPII